MMKMPMNLIFRPRNPEEDVEGGNPLTPEEIAMVLEREKNRPILVHNELMSYRDNKEWEKFIHLSLTYRNEILAEAFEYYDEVPDELKYDWVVEAYTHTGDEIPAVCKALLNLHKFNKPNLPAEWAEKETITVYRAGAETIEEADEFISWTTDKKVAFWFYYRPDSWFPKHVWQAQICPADIIAYDNGRNEAEVMQFRKVTNLIDITDEAASEAGKLIAQAKEEEIQSHFRSLGI